MHYWMIDIIMKFFLVFFFMIKKFRCFSLGGSLGARKTSRLKEFWQRYSHRALLFSIFVKLTKAEVLYIYNFWILWNKEVVMVWKWVQETACQSLNFVSFLKHFSFYPTTDSSHRKQDLNFVCVRYELNPYQCFTFIG
jgi:hypothetical protein